MSKITKWAFGNKAAVGLLTVLIMVVGIISYFRLPMEFLPSADNPQVTIITMGRGTDTKTMENEVTIPIERAVTTIHGKTSVYSTTGDGFSQVNLMFEPGSDMKQAKLDVQEAISSLDFPEYISKPVISQLNTSMIPIVNLAITFDEGLTPENIEFVEEKIKPMYESIEGVADVEIFGVASPVISVKLDDKKLTEKGVPFEAVMGVLQGQNMAVSLGEKEIGGKTSNINVSGQITSLEQLHKLLIAPDVALGDVATLEETKSSTFISRFNGKEGLDVSITKDSHSNAVAISKEVAKVTEEINKKYDHLQSKIYISAADMVETSVHTLVKEVLLGALFATIVIMVFLRNIRSTFITIVSIPLSLCLTMFLLHQSGITLNILTLGGVAVAVGRLVDDSIVVIENIYRKMQNEKFSVQLVLDATKQVGAAITASTLTTVAVFLPMSLLNGSLQEFLLPFALTVTYSLLASLIVALTLVPIMSAGLLKKAKLPKKKRARKFPKMVAWSLNHKWIVFAITFFLFAGSIATYIILPKGAIDNSTADYVYTVLKFPDETPIEEVKEKTLELEEEIRKMKGVDMISAQVGTSADTAKYGWIDSETEGTLAIMLKEDVDIDDFIKEIEKKEDQYPNAEMEVGASSFISFSAGSTNIIIDVVGENEPDLEKTAEAIKEKVENISGVEEVSTNQDEKKTVYSYVVDPAKGNTEQIAGQLGAMLNPVPIGSVTLNDQQVPVILEPLIDIKSPEDLENVPIMTQSGMVPVSSVAKLTAEERSTTQYRKDGETYLRVTASVDPSRLSEINGEIQGAIFGKEGKKGIEIPDNVEVKIGGAYSEQSDDFFDFYLTMLVSIGIVFLIMVITFKSIKAPIAILFSLPLASIGSILGIVISGIAVDITALLGALMLIGIVVTNAIVLIDRVRQNEKKMTIREALIEASATRMRPIFMTAIATICAMLPLLFKQAESGSLVTQSLAIVVIGGLAMATLLTLIVIPCVYELLYFRKSKRQRMRKLAEQEMQEQQLTV